MPHTFVCPLYICMAPYICIPPYIHMPPWGCTPPWAPCSLYFCMILEHCMLWGVVFLLNVYWDTPPLFGGASPLITLHSPHSIVGSQYIVILRDISSYVGLSPSIEGFGSVPPSLGEVWGASALQLFTCSFLYIFIVHYVSRHDHGSDYYSSSYSGIFWPVISVSGSFPDRVSSKPWCGSTTTLDAEELWRCSWLQFCAAAANSIFSASSGLCQLCYGFSTGRFLFQS